MKRVSEDTMEAARAPAAIAVANAPVSYGAFEITVGHDPNVPDGVSVLDQVAEAGYTGIDLGPAGYLGTGERLGELLAERGLGLAGAYLELPYADADALDEALPSLDELLSIFDAVGAYLPGPPPRPTLADAGSQERRSLPFRSALIPSRTDSEASLRCTWLTRPPQSLSMATGSPPPSSMCPVSRHSPMSERSSTSSISQGAST